MRTRQIVIDNLQQKVKHEITYFALGDLELTRNTADVNNGSAPGTSLLRCFVKESKECGSHKKDTSYVHGV